MYNNSILETDNYEDFELPETPIKCTFCDEVITEEYTNEMPESYKDEHFCNRFCEQAFHDNK